MHLPGVTSALLLIPIISLTSATSLERQNVICILAPNNADQEERTKVDALHTRPSQTHQISGLSSNAPDGDHAFVKGKTSGRTTSLLDAVPSSRDDNAGRKRRRKTKAHKKHSSTDEQHVVTTDSPAQSMLLLSPSDISTLSPARQEESDNHRLEHNAWTPAKSKEVDVIPTVTSRKPSEQPDRQILPPRLSAEKFWDPVAMSRARLAAASSAKEKPHGSAQTVIQLARSIASSVTAKPSTALVSEGTQNVDPIRGMDADSSFVDSRDRLSREFAVNANSHVTDRPSTAKAKKASRVNHAIPGATLVSTEHDRTQDFATRFNITWSEHNEKNNQANVWEELEKLRGKAALSAGEIQEILMRSVPGVDYPTYTWVPNTKFSCNNVNQPGFYADPEARCQVIRRCDYNGNKWNYLCPNATLFNQITLVCDWYFNIDCSKAVQYYDYSNSRLYHSDWVLLDSVPEPNQAG